MLSVSGIQFDYGSWAVLNGLEMQVDSGQVLAISGESGSGKSTLLHILAGLIRPDAGAVELDGARIDDLSERRRAAIRLRRFGFVFQFGDLLPELTIAENVSLPLRLMGRSRKESMNSAKEVLAELGIGELAERGLAEVSGGQMQRAALARALIHDPSVVLADEPTGSLDPDASATVLDALLRAAHDHELAVVLVTHDSTVADRCDRRTLLRGGRLVQQRSRQSQPG
ncbi:MAG: ABC transporter ATP-binding protein [Nocardioides sp.]|nr:ABC transporter ATP-binding protein [Nocardioides sp.]